MDNTQPHPQDPHREYVNEQAVPRTGPRNATMGVAWVFVAADIVVAAASSAGAYVIALGAASFDRGAVVAVALAVLLWPVIFAAFGLYRRDRIAGAAPGLGVRPILGATSIGILVFVMVAGWLAEPIPHGALASYWLAVIALATTVRGVLSTLVRRWRRRHLPPLRTLIVGEADSALRVSERLSRHASIRPVGRVEPPHRSVAGNGSAIDVEASARRTGADCIVVAGETSSDQLAAVASAARRLGAQLMIAQDTDALEPSRLSVTALDGFDAIAVRHAGPTRGGARMKRGLDLVVAISALVLMAPAMAAIALAIRLTSPGPAIFRQQRVTQGGRVFTMYKFRTMVSDADRVLEDNVIDLTRPFFKLENDPRLTTVGHFLRSLSLDELPQLLNVIRGDMSLVGPRPLPVEQVRANEASLASRHEMRGGLTGLWQVSGRSELDSDEAIRIDRRYIENWSLGLDLRILAMTIVTVVRRRGAY
jgi:exopolysaccharide biosynthesis polyprenyl glycosylphosphotransferase